MLPPKQNIETDTDLEPVRSLEWFRQFMSALGE
jgi:hypothetical protein